MGDQITVPEKLLSDKRIVAEIDRHLWIESEKAGYDIGFDAAKVDWLKRFSKAWIEYHMPEVLKKANNGNSSIAQPAAARSTAARTRKRYAKSYLK